MRTTDRHLKITAAVLAAISVACCVAAVPLRAYVGPAAVGAAHPSDLALGTVWPAVGAVVVAVRPRNPLGWWMLVAALIGPYQIAGLYAAATDGTGALGALAAWVSIWGFVPFFLSLPVIPQIFPDGHPLSRRWRGVLVAVLSVAAVTTVARMFSPISSDIAPGVDNPLGGPDLLNYVTAVGATALLFGAIPLGLVSLFLRMRGAREVERTQLQWLLLGGLVLVAGIVIPLEDPAAAWAFAIGLCGPPIAIGVAMVRHRLFDVELTLNRTVVFGLLTGSVVAVYALVVYGAQAIAPGSGLGVLLVAGSALAAAAARNRVQEVVDRRLFGHRHNAYAVVAQVGRGVAAASQPVEALQRVVEELRTALRLPYAAFTGDGVAVTTGVPTHGSRVVTVRALGEAVGELHVGLRTPGETWTPQQEAAVAEVGDRAGTLAYAAGLVTDIAVSRGRIVAAREEERRRLRADLHDGVAPALAGAALQLESLARRLEPMDDRLAGRALEVRDGLRSAVGELRAVVRGLRPPVLDQVGLPGALRQLVAGHESPVCTADVGPLAAVPASVEVAAYAIAAEAFTNALRHSATASVAVEAHDEGDALVVVVRDHGIGLPARPRAGVGLSSMRERAGEVGGRLDTLQTEGGGTTIRATLPRTVA